MLSTIEWSEEGHRYRAELRSRSGDRWTGPPEPPIWVIWIDDLGPWPVGGAIEGESEEELVSRLLNAMKMWA